MINLQAGGRGLGLGSFRIIFLVEPHRKGLNQRRREDAAHCSHHARRVDATAQECPERHVADQPQAYGVFDQCRQFLSSELL